MAEKGYQESFRNFEVNPSSGVWDGIESKLNQQNAVLHSQAYWLSGAVIALIAGSVGLWAFFGSDNNTSSTFSGYDGRMVLADSMIKPQPEAEEVPAYKLTAIDLKPAEPANQSSSNLNGTRGDKREASVKDDQSNENQESGQQIHANKKLSEHFEGEKVKLLAHNVNLKETFPEAPEPKVLDLGNDDEQLLDPTSKWNVGARAGISLLKAQYRTKDPHKSSLKKEVDNANGDILALEVMLTGSYQLSQHWHILGGLGLSQYQQKFAYQEPAAYKRGQSDDAEALPEPKMETANNRLSYLAIPFRLQYKIPMKRFSLGLEAGVTVQRLIKADGKALNPENQLVTSLSSDNGPFRDWQTSLNFRSSFGYQLAPNWEVNLAPKVGLSLQSLYKASYPISNRPYQLGIQTGISYNF